MFLYSCCYFENTRKMSWMNFEDIQLVLLTFLPPDFKMWYHLDGAQ